MYLSDPISAQALLFYLPRHLWKMLENGRMKFSVSNMRQPERDNEKEKKRVDELFYLYKRPRKENDEYALK